MISFPWRLRKKRACAQWRVDFSHESDDSNNMEFASRVEAGHRLGLLLRDLGVEVDLVLGLPRGGVVVAAEVARVLQRPLDVLVVRKIGHPWHREFAVGALAENDVVLLDGYANGKNVLIADDLREIIAEETARLS